MRVYLIRHGESLSNASRLRQGREGGLTQEGQAQARAVSRKINEFPIDRIFSSPFERASETAGFLAEELSLSVEYREVLGEWANPSSIIGRSIDDPEVIKAADEINLRAGDPSWRKEDGENFFDVRNRAREFLETLDSVQNESVAVVSHRWFSQVLFAYALFGESLPLELFPGVLKDLHFYNCAFGVFEREADGWKIVSWNESDHLNYLKK